MTSLILLLLGHFGHTAGVQATPLNPDGIYTQGQKPGWSVTGSGPANYTLKVSGEKVVRSGVVELGSTPVRLEFEVKEPTMLFLQLTPVGQKPLDFGAAYEPTKIKPAAERPRDFDAWWADQIKALQAVPSNPVETVKESGRQDVDYSTVVMDQVDGKRVYGQFAKPKKPGKYPAILQLQWASAPYPLDKNWIIHRAAQGFIIFNVQPHDTPVDAPADYYAGLPNEIKNYASIGNDDRNKSYFRQMYLGDYRGADYVTSRPEWDGKTLIVHGTSMGGQQAWAVAGLHAKVTHMIINVPAGCELTGPLHDRSPSYPFFPVENPKVAATAPYFDGVNFAAKIRAKSLVAMGFVDTACAPAGIWAAFNLIKGEKEAAPMYDSPHNHVATPEQQKPWTTRSEAWFAELAAR
jgi:cephalosporin-C deacetylase-like acetyl esterase